MNFDEQMKMTNIEFGDMSPQAFLLGLLSAFDNRYQACGEKFFKEITWKQFFAIICINLCKERPTINDLSEIMGSSHQNVKQILLKLEKKGFVKMFADDADRRKQRITLTEECMDFCQKNDEASTEIINKIFEGIDEKSLINTIQTIMRMEENLKHI